ncbi:MAG TPA: TRAP transporter large permease [Halanaerobiales bacterium]|nr:TRAP transporter large permease [Halanaerobiales bacterium]
MASFILMFFAILLVIGVPIGFVLAVVSFFALLRMGNPILLSLIPQRMFAGLDSFTFLAIPFFFLAGELMSKSEITTDLMEFASVVIGRIRGGLAYANILASIFFAGITGAALADVAALGSIEIPAMEEGGYDTKFAAAITVASSIIGPIIPPSIIMVIYGSIMQVSIAALFLAGIVPGLMLGGILSIMSYYYAKKNNYPKREEKVTLKEFFISFRKAVLALIMPIILLGGILSGVFTPTEAASVAAAYAFIIGFFVKKTLKLKHIPDIFRKIVLNTSIVFLVLAAASIFSWVMAFDQIPSQIANAIVNFTSNKLVVLLLINIFLLFVGMLMDVGAALIVLAPILAPIAIEFGVHPLHFGIVMSINLMIGLSTPPVGPVLFATVGITDLTIEELSKAVAPFLIGMFIFLMIITYFPQISMFLPKLFGYI